MFVCILCACICWQYADYVEIIRCSLFWQVWRKPEGGVRRKRELKLRKGNAWFRTLSFVFSFHLFYPFFKILNPDFICYLLDHSSLLSLRCIVSIFLTVRVDLLLPPVCLASWVSEVAVESVACCLRADSSGFGRWQYYFRRVNEPQYLLACQSRWWNLLLNRHCFQALGTMLHL